MAMQNQTVRLGTGILARLRATEEGERVPLRDLVVEFGAQIPPEVAWRRGSKQGSEASNLSFIEMTREQEIQLGRVKYVQEALQRIGAKFDGSRIGMDRVYYLPPELRVSSPKPMVPIQVPTVKEAIDHITGRMPLIRDNKARSWTQWDLASAEVLIGLASRVESAGLTKDILDDHQDTVVQVMRPEPQAQPLFRNAPSWVQPQIGHRSDVRE